MRLPVFKIALLYVFFALPVYAQEIRLIAPLSGTNAFLGKQMIKGAGLQAVDDACSGEQAAIAVRNVLENGARFIFGLPCIEALDSAAEITATHENDAVILSLGVQVTDITSRERRANWPVFRLGPSASGEALTIARYLKKAWRSVPFAIIDDGTLYGRQLAQNVRILLEEDNLLPVFTDTYRPLLERQTGLVRRIAKSGATHVFVGGDAYDVSIMGKDADALGFEFIFAGGNAFLAPPADGALPEGALFTALKGLTVFDMDGGYYMRLAKAGYQIGKQALKYASENDIALRSAMQTLEFKTDLGPIRFGDDGESNRQWFTVFKIKDGVMIDVTKQDKSG